MRLGSNQQTQLDEFDKIEWFGVARQLKPGLSQVEYDAMWDRFQQAKAAEQRRVELS